LRRAAAAAAVVSALLAAGCTSSSHHSNADDPVITPPASAVASSPSTAAAPTSAPVTESAPPSAPATKPASSVPSTSPAAASGQPPPPRSTCTKLTIRAIPGGASMGQEIAALQFTNDGTASCELVGYASVTLLRGGRPLGRPSQPATTATSHRTLAPGATAESLLHDYVTNCQAPLSDDLRVVAPGSTQVLVRPLQMRACLLRVDRLGAPD